MNEQHWYPGWQSDAYDPCNQTTRVIEEIHVTTPDQATLVFGATFPFQTSMWHHIVIRTPCAVSPYPRFLPTTHPTTHPRFERIAPRFEKMVCTAIFSNRGRFHCPHQAIFSNRIRHVTIFSNRSENDQTFFSNLGHGSKERSCGSKKMPVRSALFKARINSSRFLPSLK